MTRGQKIMELRRKAQLSQEELAERMNLSRQAVSKWEADLSAPSLENLQELSRIFGVSAGELLEPDKEAKGNTEKAETAAAPLSQTFALSAKRRAAAISLGILLIAGVSAALIWQQLQIFSLKNAVAELQSRGNQTIYLPSTEEAPKDVTDYQLSTVGYDREKQMLKIKVSVVPLDFTADTTAQFTVKGLLHTTTADAMQAEDGAFTAELDVPLESLMKLYFFVQQEGVTKPILLEDISSLQKRYQISGSSDFVGQLTRNYQGLSITGDVQTQLDFLDDGNNNNFNLHPVSGKVSLVVDGKTIRTEPIAGIETLFADVKATQEEGTLSGATFYTSFAEIVPWNYGQSEGYFLTRIEDNLGGTYEYRSDFEF